VPGAVAAVTGFLQQHIQRGRRRMKMSANIAKRDSKQQLVLVEVWVPNEIDSQGEFMTPETTEKAAHDFNATGKQSNVSIMHDGKNIDASVVESYIAKKGDPLFKIGTWAAVLKIRSIAVWQAIEKGVLKGVSFEGRSAKREAVLGGVKAVEMFDPVIDTISIVDRPANRKPFKMTKSDKSAEVLTAALNGIAKKIAGISKRLDAQDAKLNEQVAALDSISKGKPVAKTLVNPNADQIDYQSRKLARLQQKLEAIWERPDAASEATEAELRKSIAKCEDELFSLGHESPAATLDSNSAFAFRGGRSDFLVAGTASLEDILGISHASRNISKAEEDAVQVENCLIL